MNWPDHPRFPKAVPVKDATDKTMAAKPAGDALRIWEKAQYQIFAEIALSS